MLKAFQLNVTVTWLLGATQERGSGSSTRGCTRTLGLLC